MRPGDPAQPERLHARQRPVARRRRRCAGRAGRRSGRRAPERRPARRRRRAAVSARRPYRDRASLCLPAAPSPPQALCRAPRPARGCLH